MHKGKKVACVIPARLESTRFPRKVLKYLAGKPLLQWVYEAAVHCDLFDEICFAVDAKETQDLVMSFGAKALMTSVSCLNGTERLIEVKERYRIDADVWVNWQADEPFIEKAMILDLLQSIDKDHDVWTLRKKIEDPHEIEDTSVVKVVVNHVEEALYFSRYSIPFYRNTQTGDKYKHIGIYAFTSEALDKIKVLQPCPLELAESLEQLRFLYFGMKIATHETKYQTLGIDLQEHLEIAELKVLSSNLV